MDNYKNIFVITLGFVFFNILFPVLGIHFNSVNSFNSSFYDYIFVFYLFIIFLVTPTLLIFCLCATLNKYNYNYKNFMFFLFVFCVLKQLEFQITSKYYIQSNSLDFLTFLIFVSTIFLSVIIYIFAKKNINHFYKFNKLIIFSGFIVIAYMIYDISNIINKKNYDKFKSKEITQVNSNESVNKKIFILTFEKLAYDLIVNENDNIREQFTALKKFEKNSTLFTDFKTVSTQTNYALKALYNGQLLKNHKIDDNKSKHSVFKKLNKLGYKIHYINDVINYPCRTMYVNCYKTNIGKKNIGNKSVMVRKWIYAFLQNYVPHFILWYINPIYEYDFKFVSRNEKKETKNFLQILNDTESQKAAYIAHFFLSDGYTNFDEIDNIKKNALEEFDTFISKFYKHLKEKNIFQNSFVAIMSDTGSELSNVKMVYGSVKNQVYHRNSDKIFFLIKNFNQVNSEKNQNHFSLFDFRNLFDRIHDNKKIDKFFEGNRNFRNKLYQFTDIGIVEYLKNTNKWVRQ